WVAPGDAAGDAAAEGSTDGSVEGLADAPGGPLAIGVSSGPLASDDGVGATVGTVPRPPEPPPQAARPRTRRRRKRAGPARWRCMDGSLVRTIGLKRRRARSQPCRRPV